MHEATQAYATLFKLAAESQETELVKRAAAQILTPGAHLMKFLRDPRVAWGVGGTGLGAAGLGIPLAYSVGKHVNEKENKLVRNLAFGGGLLSGLVAPSVLKGLGQMVGLAPASGTGY